MVRGLIAFCYKLCLEHEEWNAAHVVCMKMCEKDRIDSVTIDAEFFHRNERGGAAIDEKIYSVSYNMKARVEPPTRSECVAAAEKLNSHFRTLFARTNASFPQ